MNAVHDGRNGLIRGVDLKGENRKPSPRMNCVSNSQSDFFSQDTPGPVVKMGAIERIARECSYDIIHHVSKIRTNKVKPANTRYAKTLRRTVDEISVKHDIFFTSSMRRLDVSVENARITIDNVANEMLLDREFNWGRLSALFAFFGKIAKHCVDECEANRRANVVDTIADYTADYVAESLSDRIRDHGGWDAFVDFFPEPDHMENTIWKGLLCTVVGLGALATMVVAR